MKKEFTALLIDWYKHNARSLPWRGHSDPYAIWVSEIMLQQTRVDTVIPYFHKWMNLFPDIAALASAAEDSVLKAWEGLGYYSRARSMQKQRGYWLGILMANYQPILMRCAVCPVSARTPRLPSPRSRLDSTEPCWMET